MSKDKDESETNKFMQAQENSHDEKTNDAMNELSELMDTANIDAILGTTFFQQSLIEIDFQNEIVGMTLD